MKHYHHDPTAIVGVEGVIYNESGGDEWRILVHDDQYASGGFDVIRWRAAGLRNEKSVVETHVCSCDELARVLDELDVEWQ